MGFRENLLKKIEIKRLAAKVVRSINPADSSQRIDLDAMEQLLSLGGYERFKERDLALFRLHDEHLLLLDNELKIYATTAQDIALRKSPTVKEMISIRNAIKILNDKDVVISRKADTVRQVQTGLLQSLDLSYTAADIASIADDGIEALKNQYADGVIDMLRLLTEVLEFVRAPKAFQAAHHKIWGKLTRSDKGEQHFGPVVLFDLMHNRLHMHPHPIDGADKAEMDRYAKIIKGEAEAALTGAKVMEELKKMVMEAS